MMSIQLSELRGRGWCALARLIVLVVLACGGTSSFAQTQKLFVDATVDVGYASNPFLRVGDGTSSPFLDVSLNPSYVIADETGTASLEAHYQRTEYLRRYDASQSYGARARGERKLSEKLEVHAALSFYSSILGERGSQQRPTVGLPGSTFPVGVISPDISLVGLGQRQNDLRLTAGSSYKITEVDLVSAEANVGRVIYDGGQTLSDFRSYGATVGYARALSPLTQVGVRASAQRVDYDVRGSSSSIYQPQLTVTTKLSPTWDLAAAAGPLIINMRTAAGTDNSTGLSGKLRTCRTSVRTTLCMRAYRDAAATGLGDVSRQIGGSIDYRYRLNETDNVRAHVDYSKVRQGGALTPLASFSYFNADVSYERKITNRLTGGAALGYRDAFDSIARRSPDVSGQIFIRARLGDLR